VDLNYFRYVLSGCTVAVALCVSGVAVADVPPPGLPGGHLARFDAPPELPVRQSPFLEGLRLEEEQIEKAFVINHEFELQIHEKQRLVDKFRRSLNELSFAETFDESRARESAKLLASSSAELHLLISRRDARLYAVLTAAQRTELAERKARRDFIPPQNEGRPERGSGHRGLERQ